LRFVRGRVDTWWAPARFHHALFKLMALVVASRLRAEPKIGTVRVVDSHQNPIESYAIAVWCMLTCTSYFESLLAPALGWVAGGLLSIVLGSIAIHVLVVGLGLLVGAVARNRDADRTRTVTGLSMLVLTGVAVFAATVDGWVRWVGASFLFALLLNGLAAALLWPMRAQMAAVNRERGVVD
jgi:hypothetical protein